MSLNQRIFENERGFTRSHSKMGAGGGGGSTSELLRVTEGCSRAHDAGRRRALSDASAWEIDFKTLAEEAAVIPVSSVAAECIHVLHVQHSCLPVKAQWLRCFVHSPDLHRVGMKSPWWSFLSKMHNLQV